MTTYHKNDEGHLILDEAGDPIPSTVCLCAAHSSSECCCGAWDTPIENEFELVKAEHKGFMKAIAYIRHELNRSGKPTSWFDAMLDELEECEVDCYAGQVGG